MTVGDPSQNPRVVSDGDVNLRDGPRRVYPGVATLHAEQAMEILGRHAAGDWWQLAWTGGNRVWVAGTVVRVLGRIDIVALARDIPTPPPAPTATPQPTRPAVTPGPDFKRVSVRLWDVIENGGSSDGRVVNSGLGRVLHVSVIDNDPSL